MDANTMCSAPTQSAAPSEPLARRWAAGLAALLAGRFLAAGFAWVMCWTALPLLQAASLPASREAAGGAKRKVP